MQARTLQALSGIAIATAPLSQGSPTRSNSDVPTATVATLTQPQAASTSGVKGEPSLFADDGAAVFGNAPSLAFSAGPNGASISSAGDKVKFSD